MKHDLIPFENLQRDARVCLLVSEKKPLPKVFSIKTKRDSWEQELVIQDKVIIEKFANNLGHFNHQCQFNFKKNKNVCNDTVTDPSLCAFYSNHLQTIVPFQASDNQTVVSKNMRDLQLNLHSENRSFKMLEFILHLFYTFQRHWISVKVLGPGESESKKSNLQSESHIEPPPPDDFQNGIVETLMFQNKPLQRSQIRQIGKKCKMSDDQLEKIANEMLRSLASDMIDEIAQEEGVYSIEEEDIRELGVINQNKDSLGCQRKDFLNKDIMAQHEDSEGLGQLNEVEVLLAVPPLFSDLKCQTPILVENLDYFMSEHDLEECNNEKEELCSQDF